MNFKRYIESSDTWVDSHYIMGTDTDTITPPTTIYADGTNASLSIKGNTTQSGTPSPSAPVDVVGVGELETSGEHTGQYKIPILCGGTTTPVYMGQVQSERKIKKLVLTGDETYTYESSYSRIITTLPNAKIEGLRLTQVYCTHFISVYDGRPLSEVPNNSIYSSDVSADRFFIKTTDYTSATDFKTYLQQQYANGTPVTVWHVLATPATGIVNEPLRKIGDYADTVSGITIPTIAGANTLSVDTTLQPSEVTVNYKGWHPVQSVHERESGAWD